MKGLRWVLLAALLVLPFSMKANAQVGIGVGIGPVVAAPYGYYGPPDCEWGYYSYYPYACAPYGYYGPDWFAGGVFIGVGPWYGWGRGWRPRVRLRPRVRIWPRRLRRRIRTGRR